MKKRSAQMPGKSRLAREALKEWLAERAPQLERVLNASLSSRATIDTSEIRESERDLLWKWIQRHDPPLRALLKSDAFQQIRAEITEVFCASVKSEMRDRFRVSVGIPSTVVYRVARLEQRREASSVRPAIQRKRGAQSHPASLHV